ncbi:hypothetical protein LEMLEM_LOCUS16763, partial [Lemmus lemmus]
DNRKEDWHYPLPGREKARQEEPRLVNSAGCGDGIAISVGTESRGPCSPWLEATLSAPRVLQEKFPYEKKNSSAPGGKPTVSSPKSRSQSREDSMQTLK